MTETAICAAAPKLVTREHLKDMKPGAVLVDHWPPPRPEFDLSGIDLAPVGDPIDLKPRPAPLAIDTSALSVVEVPAQAEKPPSELHKLLTSHVD